MVKNFVIFIMLSVCITSCKSTRGSSATIKKLSAKQIIKKNNKISFDQASVKANVTIKYRGKGDLPTIKASLRMLTDSVIWMSFSKLGFPLAKLKISPNRVQFYEKITKTYFDGDFSLISKTLGSDFDFYKIQNLFVGEALLHLNKEKFYAHIENKTYALKLKEEKELFDLYFWIDALNFKIKKEQIKHKNKGESLTISYPEYMEVSDILFPKGFRIEVMHKKEQTFIDVNYKNVIFDEVLKFPFKTPNSYKKIELK